MTRAERRFYGRRKGPRLTAKRQALVETLLPKVRLELPDQGSFDLSAQFGNFRHRPWLEIGFGKGEHLAALAASHPDVPFIGCEPFLNGIAGLLTEIETRRLTNIRIYPDDARDLMDVLPDQSLDRIYLLHPDPWPKARHRTRRIINPGPLDHIARLLPPGREFRVVTDHPTYRQWCAVHMARRPDFRWTARQPADWRAPPMDWSDTRYAQKARREGREDVFLTYLRS